MHDDLPAIGATVGSWRILERFDSGSFGVVYRAQRADSPESPPVALKIARQPGDPRFEREAEVLQRSHHPSIPRYEGKGVWTGPDGHDYPYLVMEWVQGSTLYPWFQEHLRSSLDVLQVAAQLAGALAFVHELGVIHRDVKGDNIRVTPEGRAVLLDWGSCWLPTARLITDTLLPPGTSAYRPPEQREFMYRFRKDTEARWESRPSDDLYALGTTLYRLVTGTYLPPCTDGAGRAACAQALGEGDGKPRPRGPHPAPDR
jgi:eukaryotic-like serine/threonine-protein kinase